MANNSCIYLVGELYPETCTPQIATWLVKLAQQLPLCGTFSCVTIGERDEDSLKSQFPQQTPMDLKNGTSTGGDLKLGVAELYMSSYLAQFSTIPRVSNSDP